MIRYEHDRARGRSTAVFWDGGRVPVSASRVRAYPALAGDAPDTTEAYQLAIARMSGGTHRVADLGAGAGAGAAALREAGFEVVGFDADPDAVAFASRLAPEVQFEQCAIESAALGSFDTLVMVDVLGLLPDDAAVLRALARGVAPEVRLIGAVARAEVGQTLAAPARRAYSPESLDALLVRNGWAAPVLVGQTAGLLVFETRRVASLETARAIELAEAARNSSSAERVMSLLAIAAQRTQEASEARELLLALGELQLAGGHPELAEQSFAAANAVAPSCAGPLVALANVRLAAGDMDDAEALLDHALGYDATCVAAWRGLAGIFARRRELARAAESLDCAASLDPSEPAIAAELARLLSSLGDTRGASRVLERLLPFDGATDAIRASYGWLSLAANTVEAVAPQGRARASTGVYPVVADVLGDAALRRSLAS